MTHPCTQMPTDSVNADTPTRLLGANAGTPQPCDKESAQLNRQYDD